MILLFTALVLIAASAAAGGFVAAAWRYKRRALIAEEYRTAALADADGLAEQLRGLQASLELGLPLTPGDISTPMPRTEALVLAAAARDLRSSPIVAVLANQLSRRAKRADSQT